MKNFRFFAALSLLVGGGATGCGDISDPGSTPSGGAAGRAGTAGSAGTGQGGSGGAGGSGGNVDAGGAQADAGDDGGAAGAAGSTGNPLPPGCPAPAPVAVGGQKIAIQSIKFASEDDPEGSPAEVVLRNVSDADVTLVGGRQGWQWCNVPAYWALTEGGNVTLKPGATYSFIPYYNLGGPRPLYRGDEKTDTNELGIYPTTGTFDESDKILAFVVWGLGSDGESRESIGAMSGLWTFGDKIAIGPNDAGFVATGVTNRGAGYTGVPARCLVAPPNP
jgi:hypothetical protein